MDGSSSRKEDSLTARRGKGGAELPPASRSGRFPTRRIFQGPDGGFTGEVLQNEENRQLTLGLWLAATLGSSLASDLKGGGVATANINPRVAFEIADMIAMGSVGDTWGGRASRDAACAAGIELNEILNEIWQE